MTGPAPRLPRRTVDQLVTELAPHLTGLQVERLRALAALIGDDTAIPLDDALRVATEPGSVDPLGAFRTFRAELRRALAKHQPPLGLAIDGRKRAPLAERRCWFTGPDRLSEETAELSRVQAARVRVDHPVTALAAELTREIVVHVSGADVPKSSPTHALQRRFVKLLETMLTIRTDRRYRLTHTLGLGVRSDDARRRLLTDADVVVALVGPEYYADADGEAGMLAGLGIRPIQMALETVPPGEVERRGLPVDQIRRFGQPFDSLRTEPTRKAFVADCVVALCERLDPAAQRPVGQPARTDTGTEQWVVETLRRRYPGETLVELRGTETSLDAAHAFAAESLRDGPARPRGDVVQVVDRLLAWATDATQPTLCALLGDLGMGKTTTTKLLTERLLARRAADPTSPLPILFDLKELNPKALGAQPNLRHIVDLLLQAGDDAAHRPSADDVLDLIAAGNCVVIFDGLDEVLVHLDQADGQRFTRALWRATERREGAGAPSGAARAPKLLLSCRTHYFRSVQEEVTHLTGQHRDGPRGREYLALLMLPFDEQQIREYLAANVSGDVDGWLALMGEVHNLRELAERPLTLRMIGEQLPMVEQAKLAGRAVHAVDLYRSFVEQWLHRDEGKHVLLREQKPLLMEHLAAELWRSGRTEWTSEDIEAWLLAFLRARPELREHYDEHTPTLWKEDLRTATFLVRGEDDRFAFAHTSLREYFLARYLQRALLSPGAGVEEAAAAWSLPIPSTETLAFLGQLLAGLDDAQLATARLTLTRLGRAEGTPAGQQVGPSAVLAFAYGLTAARAGYPHQSFAGARLDGADLRGWSIGLVDAPSVRVADAGEYLDLTGASFAGVTLRDAALVRLRASGASFAGADLTRAELHRCTLTAASFVGATLVGTCFRHCTLDGADLTGATTHRTQAVACSSPPSAAGWLVVPIATDVVTGELLRTLTGHTGGVWGVAWDPAGDRVATAGADGTPRIWDAATGQLLRTLTGHTGGVWGVAWDPAGQRVATAGADRTARIWDAATGQLLTTLTGHTSSVLAVAWDPAGQRLATASADRTARIWDATTGQMLTTLTGHGGAVLGVAWDPAGHRLATADADRTARIWDATTGQMLTTLTGHGGAVLGVAWDPAGHRLATAGDDLTARIWDATTGQALTTLTGHGVGKRLHGEVWGVAWDPGGQRVATAGADRTARIWDVTTGQLLTTLTGHGGAVLGVVWDPGGHRVAAVGADGTARVWDAVTGEVLTTLTGHTSAVRGLRGVAWEPGGHRVATAGADRAALIWDAATGQLLRSLTGHTGWVWGVAWDPGGHRVATAGDDRTARIWDTATGQLLTTLTGHTGTVRAVAWDPGGQRVATAGADRTARIWDATTGEALTILTGHTDGVWGVAWEPGGQRVATAGDDGTARIWDPTTGELLITWLTPPLPRKRRRIWDAATRVLVTTLRGHGTGSLMHGVRGVAWEPGGQRVATVGGDGTARIWDAATGEALRTLTGHTGPVRGVAWEPGGQRVATVGGDGTARIWDAATGEALRTLTGHTDWVWGVAWEPGGQRVATVGDDGTARIWDAGTGEQVGWWLEQLPESELVTRDAASGAVIGASPRAWRWLGCHGPDPTTGEITRLPAETHGLLPPLSRTTLTPGN